MYNATLNGRGNLGQNVSSLCTNTKNVATGWKDMSKKPFFGAWFQVAPKIYYIEKDGGKA